MSSRSERCRKANTSRPIICRQQRKVQMACMRNCLDTLRK
ncbi:TRASH domain-containing protein [Dorea amylophila]|uniref:TRASH domain-containing protein n=1 Tax=Dorea amylophila TaxID=2981789 RepID=A0ABW8B3S6_9FIRM